MKIKIRQIKNRITDLMLFTSAHGIPRMIRTKKLLIRIMWIMFLLVASVFCIFYIHVIIINYLSFEIFTSISVIREQVSQFPTISLCSTTSPMNYSLDEFIIKCEFNEVKFKQNDIENYFNTFNHPKYGQCYQFNSGINMTGQQVNLLYTVLAGVKNGFLLDVTFKRFNNSDFNELIIYFHNNSINSSHLYFSNKNGYYLSSGTMNFFSIERMYDINLPEPYSRCLKDINSFSQNKTIIEYLSKTKSAYSQNLCMRFCSYLHLIEESKCGCQVDNLEQVAANCIKEWSQLNKNQTLIDCSIEFLRKFNTNQNHAKCSQYCPLECESIDYRIIPYSEIIPIHDGNISNLSRSIFDFMNQYDAFTEVKRNHISIAVNYNELEYTVIERKPKTETFNLVSNIGGVFSLFLGVSFISFFELIEIVFEIIIILCSKKTTANNNVT